MEQPNLPAFTYEEPKKESDLQQGDLLSKTVEIEKKLGKLIPEFLSLAGNYFLVLTQSCDLVWRDGKTTAKEISICNVESFDDYLISEISSHQNAVDSKLNICKESVRSKLYLLLERIFNNNEKDLFYLHEDLSIGLSERSIANLRMIATVPADLLYDDFLNERVLSLRGEFKACLGQKVGIIFSRVGTEDWVPDNITKDEFAGLINFNLDTAVDWQPDKFVDVVRKKFKDTYEAMDSDMLSDQASTIKVQKRREKVVGAIRDVLDNLELEGALVTQVLKRLANNPDFRSGTDG